MGCETHLGEIVFFFCDGRAVCADDFNPLWCALVLEKDSVGVLGSGLDGFSLDGLNYFMDGMSLTCGFNYVGLPDVAW